jgi:hypothetical protein
MVSRTLAPPHPTPPHPTPPHPTPPHPTPPHPTLYRRWVAEENRHGDLLNKYLWLGGRVDMRAVENTVQRLVGAGMDIGTENNPYL